MLTSRRALPCCIAWGVSATLQSQSQARRPREQQVTWCSPTNLRAPTASPAPLVPQTPPLSEHQLSALGDAITSELLPVEEAQKLKVHKFSKFFSEEDIKLIFDFKHAQGNSLGTTRRGNTGMKALDSPWVTTYLSTDNLLERCHPKLVQRLVQAAIKADEIQGWGLLRAADDSPCSGRLNFRVMEMHNVSPGGALSDKCHFDGGSLVTLDVMLSSTDDFDGGSFATPECDGSTTKHEFTRGDLMVFPSHKYHFVEPVTGGHRTVLVMELWRGESRGCAHRCLQHLGACDYSATRSKVDTILHASFPDVDPW